MGLVEQEAARSDEAGSVEAGRLPLRRVKFEYPDGLDPAWISARPEFAYIADGVSLTMPYAEPLFIRAVRQGMPDVDEALRTRTEDYIKQETGHYREHRRFNAIVREAHPGVERVERWIEKSAEWVSRRSLRFNLAFAAGGETMSFLLARWVDKHSAELFAGADPVVSTLFLWHLAEEVEHKSAASDVYEEVDGSKLRYLWATVLGSAMLFWFVWLSTMIMFKDDGRLFNPVSHWRILRWGVSLAFELLPAVLMSALPGHGPRDFANPSLLETWLRQYDPETETMPLWETSGRTATQVG